MCVCERVCECESVCVWCVCVESVKDVWCVCVVCVCVCAVCVCVCVVCVCVCVCVLCVCSTGMLWGRPGVGIRAAHRCCVSVFAAGVWREFCATRSRVCPAWRRSSRPDPAADAGNSL